MTKQFKAGMWATLMVVFVGGFIFQSLGLSDTFLNALYLIVLPAIVVNFIVYLVYRKS